MTCRPDRSDAGPGVLVAIKNPRTSAPEPETGAGASGMLPEAMRGSSGARPRVARGAVGCHTPAVPHSSSVGFPLALQSRRRTVEDELAPSRCMTPSNWTGCAGAFEQHQTQGQLMENGSPVPWGPAPGVPLHKPGIYRSAGEAVATLSVGLAIVLSPTAFLWALWEVVS